MTIFGWYVPITLETEFKLLEAVNTCNCSFDQNGRQDDNLGVKPHNCMKMQFQLLETATLGKNPRKMTTFALYGRLIGQRQFKQIGAVKTCKVFIFVRVT